MPLIPPWLVTTKGPLTAVITPLSIAADGTTTELTGNVKDVTATLQGISYELNRRTAEIRPLTSALEHHVPVSSGMTMSISEFIRSNSGSNKLTDLVFTAISSVYTDYVKIVITRGPNTITYYGLIQGFSEQISEDGCVSTVSFQPVDPGTRNPVVV